MSGSPTVQPDLLTAIVTPFDRSGRLDLTAVPSILEYQQAAGVDGVVVCGTNGEGTGLSVEERKALLSEVNRLRSGLKVIAATGAASIPDTQDLTRHAAAEGADAALVLPPFFFKHVTEAGVIDYFSYVLDNAELPVLLYNIPQFTAVPITRHILDRLSGRPELAGVKDSTGDWPATEALIRGYPALRIYCGSDLIATQAYRAGGAGSISGGANAFPAIVAEVRRQAFTARSGEAALRLKELLAITAKYPLIAANKSVMALRGLPRLYVRPPLVDLTVEQEESLRSELEAAGVEGLREELKPGARS